MEVLEQETRRNQAVEEIINKLRGEDQMLD